MSPVKARVRIEVDCDHGLGICLRETSVFSAPTHQEAMNAARAEGWYFRGQAFALCPKHNAERVAALTAEQPRACPRPSGPIMIISIENGGTPESAWAVPQTEVEQARMASYVAAAGETPGRCATCAFRTGTNANRSHLVLELVEMCLVGKQSFHCHTSDRPCAGFVALEQQVEVREGVLSLFRGRVLASLFRGRTVPQVSLTPENDKGPQMQALEVLESTEVSEPSTRATGRD